MREKLESLKQSGVGRFVQKLTGDRFTELAILLAWGSLNTFIPVILGLLALGGLVLRDPERLQQMNETIVQLFPDQVSEPLTTILDGMRDNAGIAGIIGIALLLWNGSGFFANMQTVFNKAYHVEDRGFVKARLVAVAMLFIAGGLMVLSILANSAGSILAGFGEDIASVVPGNLPVGGALAFIIGWAVSIGIAVLVFLVLYKVLPNKPQTWKQALPGAGLTAFLFLLILQLFPLYLTFFGERFESYAVLGVVLLLMIWSYFLGIALVIGAELNAYLEMPHLAEQSQYSTDGRLRPNQVGYVARPRVETGGGFKNRVIGIAGLIAAVIMNRRRSRPA